MGWILLTIAAVWLIGGFVLQRHVLFPRHVIPPFDRSRMTEPAGLESFRVGPDDAPVEAWYLPADGAAADVPAPLMVIAHGNGELIEMWAPIVAPYRGRGMGVLLVEYRGYGRSGGSPSQAGITADFLQAIEQTAARDEVDADRLIYYGFSIGGGVLCDVARTRPPAAMILHNTFTSTGSLAWRAGYPGFLLRDPFDNLSFLETYAGPVLILHGKADRVVPASHATRLHAAAADSTLILTDAGHDDFDPTDPQLRRTIGTFLAGQGLAE